MTYILAREIGDVACIVADSVVTNEFTDGRKEYSTTAQKTGILFDGCIFGGACLDLEYLLEFLQRAQDCVRPFSSIQDKWNAFEDFCKTYDSYPIDRAFEIVVITRSSGKPAIYQLDSMTRRLQRVSGGTSIGSGKRYLDAQIEALERSTSAFNPGRFIENQQISLECFPYIYAGALNNIASGPDGRYLIQQGIGGYYNFIWQDSTTDSWQEPAIFVYVERGRDFDGLGYTYFRTAFVENCFTVLYGAGEGNQASMSIATSPIVRPDLFSGPLEYEVEKLQEIGERAQLECRSNPYSHLIGMDINTRRPFPLFIYTDKLECFDIATGPSGWFSDALRYGIGSTDKQAAELRDSALVHFEHVMKPALETWIKNPSDRDIVEAAVVAHGGMVEHFYRAYSEDKELVFDANNEFDFRQAFFRKWPQNKLICDTIEREPLEERCERRKEKLVVALKELLRNWEELLIKARDRLGGTLPLE